MKKKIYPLRFGFFNIRRRAPRDITLAEAEAMAAPYGLADDVRTAVLRYGLSPREALQEWDIIA